MTSTQIFNSYFKYFTYLVNLRYALKLFLLWCDLSLSMKGTLWIKIESKILQ